MLNYKALLCEAYEQAALSPDPSTQNGALLVSSGGLLIAKDYNRFPQGVRDTPERWNDRPTKYKLVNHAERTVLCRCAKLGIATAELTMVCCWAACSVCAQIIIDCGIKQLVTHKQAMDMAMQEARAEWLTDIKLANEMLAEAHIWVEHYDGVVGGPRVRHSGKYWNP